MQTPLQTAPADSIEGSFQQPPSINIEEIQGWLSNCKAGHGTRCQPRTSTSKGGAAWLVDVQQNCIVKTGPFHQYMALSYIWGDVVSSQLTLSNLGRLQRPGSLVRGPGIKIPQTIAHTMQLVNRLGYRYLWVDRFCIIQDDVVSKHAQINQMADIYENAHLTVIAAGFGFSSTRGPEKPDEEQFKCGCWARRRLYFSLRKLKFQDSAVIWECRCETWYESTGVTGTLPGIDFDNNDDDDDNNFVGRMPRVTPWNIFSGHSTSLNQYLNMVQQYNTRRLSYPEDGMLAFAGVTSRLSKTFEGGFLWGLPVTLLDIALLWQPSRRLVRREPSRVSQDEDPVLPSWSWVGWQGNIDGTAWISTSYDLEDRGIGCDLSQGEAQITPLCIWKYEDNGLQRRVETLFDTRNQDKDKGQISGPLEFQGSPTASIKARAELAIFRLGRSSGAQQKYVWITGLMTVAPGAAGSYANRECKLVAISKVVARCRDFPMWSLVTAPGAVNFSTIMYCGLTLHVKMV
ncbi:heterokaryon incompatibility protein-domain-containing protein [Xylariales sp. AK1849]|nr:heterokaryon incompatibility protein-domain-containing protein [Xylariales sp. AK1849]